MRHAFVMCLCVLAGCTPLRPLDPLDGGRVSAPDARREPALDARLTDAPVADAPGLDAAGGDAFAVDAPQPADAPARDAGCVEPASCRGTSWRRCEGGALVESSCALGCLDEGGAHCAEMVPSNVESTLLARATDDVVVPDGVDVNTDECREGWIESVVATQAGGGEVCVLVARDLRVRPGTTLAAAGQRPLVLLSSGTITVDGVIDVSARADAPGVGGGSGAYESPATGPAPGGDGMTAMPYADGGGGGGGACGAGGPGGMGVRSGTVPGGAGGSAGTSTGEPLQGGSGGGRGGPGLNGGRGGAGGGAIQLTAMTAIILRGELRAGGGAGEVGEDRLASNWGSGGGGGSGGTIVVEAPMVTIASGAGLLTSGGGGGAGSDGAAPERDAQDGGGLSGRAAGGTCLGAEGGDGGMSGGGDTSSGDPGESDTNGGGGGGGAGCIVVRSLSTPGSTGARLSPSGTGFATLPLHVR